MGLLQGFLGLVFSEDDKTCSGIAFVTFLAGFTLHTPVSFIPGIPLVPFIALIPLFSCGDFKRKDACEGIKGSRRRGGGGYCFSFRRYSLELSEEIACLLCAGRSFGGGLFGFFGRCLRTFKSLSRIRGRSLCRGTGGLGFRGGSRGGLRRFLCCGGRGCGFLCRGCGRGCGIGCAHSLGRSSLR